jgi:DinB superfamily
VDDLNAVTSHSTTWVDALAPGAPDIVGAWRAIDEGRLLNLRREVRRRSGTGSAERIVPQLATLADALTAIVEALPDEALTLPGDEGDWNMTQAIGHDCESRVGLCLAASMTVAGRWPADAPRVVQGIPGLIDADRATLLRKIAQSQRLVERAGRTIAGHETMPCPLDHPQVGRLRCGEWLVFAGVHDLLHLEQLHAIAAPVGIPA